MVRGNLVKGRQFFKMTGMAATVIRVPDPGPGQVLLKVAGNGLCGSDLHIMNYPPYTVVGRDRPGPYSPRDT